MRKVLKVIGIIIGIVLLLAAVVLIVWSALEYKPKPIEKVETESASGAGVMAEQPLKTGETLRLLSFNIGYGGLGAEQDFFMDGGEMVQPEKKEVVEGYLTGISDLIAGQDADIVMLQEVDKNSKRSYHIDEQKWISDSLAEAYPEAGYSTAFARNFDVFYVPIPFPQMIGKVKAGQATWTRFPVTDSYRVALPTPYTWPVRTAQLKRCLLVERIPVAGTDKELVLINLHLEAYDDGSGKEAQTKALMGLLAEEYKKGNYCIAGGDFNQTFDTIDTSAYPLVDTEYFEAGVIESASLPDGFSFVADSRTPSARLLNMPYDKTNARTQYYVIDGYIVSENVKVERVETLNQDFQYSDHNPVLLEAVLEP